MIQNIARCLLIAMTASGNAYAEWTFVDANEIENGKVHFYIDKSSIKKKSEGNKTIVSATALSDFSQPQHQNNATHKSLRFPREYNCSTKTYRDLGVTVYSNNMATGRILFSERNPQRFEKVTPDSPMEKEIALVCASQDSSASTDQVICSITGVGKIRITFNAAKNYVSHENATATFDRVITSQRILYSIETSTGAIVNFDVDRNSRSIKATLTKNGNALDTKYGKCE